MEQTGERELSGSAAPAPAPSPAAALLRDAGWLRDQYVVQGRTLREIGRTAGGAGPWTVARALERAGVPRRPRGTPPGRAALPERLADPAWLYQQYVDLGLSLEQVALRARSTPKVVKRALTQHGIPRRPRRS